MKKILLGVLIASLSTAAFAQGMPGGGMDGGMGGMGGGGMGGGGMGGMRGGRRGGMGGGMGGPGGGTHGPAAIKPLKRDKIEKPVTEMFRIADTNHDGTITLEELQALLVQRRDAIIRTRFDAIDGDHNGTISLAEFIAWQTHMGSAAGNEEEAMGDNGPIPDSIPVPLGHDDEDRILRRLIDPLNATVIASANSNYDRGVSLEELLAYEYKKFDAADADKDGWLTPEEMRALGGGGGRGRGGFGGGPGRDGPPAPPDGE